MDKSKIKLLKNVLQEILASPGTEYFHALNYTPGKYS